MRTLTTRSPPRSLGTAEFEKINEELRTLRLKQTLPPKKAAAISMITGHWAQHQHQWLVHFIYRPMSCQGALTEPNLELSTSEEILKLDLLSYENSCWNSGIMTYRSSVQCQLTLKCSKLPFLFGSQQMEMRNWIEFEKGIKAFLARDLIRTRSFKTIFSLQFGTLRWNFSILVGWKMVTWL